MSIQKQVINVAAHVILGTHLWDTVLDLVTQIDGESQLSGQQKHDQVNADLAKIFKDVGLSLLNLAIELGVTYLSLSQPAAMIGVAPLASLAQGAIQKAVDKDVAAGVPKSKSAI